MKLSKLEKLLIGEVSGVDDPANEIPGWMVMKAKDSPSAADPAAEERSPTLLEKLSGFFGGDDQEVIDMTKDELNEVLEERFAALQESLSKSSEEEPAAPAEEAPAEGEEEETETPAEETPAEEAPAEDPAEEEETEDEVEKAETPAEAAPALDAEALAKAIEDAVAKANEPILQILDAVIDRFEPVERALAIRKSLDGQETPGAEGEAKSASPVAGAIRKALNL